MRKLFGKFLQPLEHRSFDPSDLDDEIAINTDWEQANKIDHWFPYFNLETNENEQIMFVLSSDIKCFIKWVYRIWALSILALGLSMLIMGKSFAYGYLHLFVVLTIVAGVARFIEFYASKTITFDKHENKFWKENLKSELSTFPLESVHALQLIYKSIGTTATYYTYELNIVFNDATRQHLVVYDDKNELVKDAETLSKYLGVLIWDASEFLV